MTYFSFTTLTTVGLGDFHPKSDYERIFCAIIMMSGVISFSIIMNVFVGIIEQFQNLNKEIDEGDALTSFFSLVHKFNGNVACDERIKIKIEDYFMYKWKADKNSAINDPEEIVLMN